MTALKPQESSPPPTGGTTPPGQLPTSPRPRPTDDDIEAVIQAATANRGSPTNPPRDTRTQLFVGNLPYRVRWQDLKDLFRKAGTVLRADVSLGPDNRSRGYGTVLLATAEDAGRAIDMFNGYNWQTRVLEVRPDRLPSELDVPNSVGPMIASGLQSPVGYGPTMTPMQTSFPTEDALNALQRPSSSTLNRTLFVGNLPFHCQWQDLKDLFRQAGTILRADVAMGQDGRSRGFGMVSFATDQDAERAVKMFNGYEYNGRPLKVHHDKYSQSMSPMPSSPVPGYYASSPMMNGMGQPNGYPFDHFMVYGQPASPFGSHPPTLSQHPSFHLQQALHIPQPTKEFTIPSADSTPPLTMGSSPGTQDTKASTSPHQHPLRPGSITLPPLPPPGSIMMPSAHTLSPYGMYPMGTPLMGHPISSLHHHVLMTPHGLPPMTPSMPSFGYISHPSPGVPGPYASPHSAQPHAQHMQPQVAMSNTAASISKDASFVGGTATAANVAVSPQPGPSMMNAAGPMSAVHSFGYNMGLLSPGLPFSPGVLMTPSGFWGSPARGGINPAVGAPVHMPSAPVSTAPSDSGYFPPVDAGYFPPVASSATTSIQNGGTGNLGRTVSEPLTVASSSVRDGAMPSLAAKVVAAMHSQGDMGGILERFGKMSVSADAVRAAAGRPGLVRGDSDPTNSVSVVPSAPVRHISVDALGNGAGVSVNAHALTGGVSRTPAPGALNLSGLGLRLDQKRVF